MEYIADIPVPQVVEELVELQIVGKFDETPEFDAGAGEDPFAKVKGLITGLISRLQEKILQFIGKAVDIPVLAQRQIHMNRTFRTPWRFPSCNTLIKWSMSLLCWSRRFGRGEDSRDLTAAVS